MKKIILVLCGFFTLTLFTGCIDIFEDLVFNKNGSGHLHQKIDMQKMMDMMKSLKSSSADQTDGSMNSFSELTNKWESLKNMDGISNVRINSDTTNFIFEVDYDFSNSEVLNKAFREQNGGEGDFKNLYQFEKKLVSRSGISDIDKLLGTDEGEESLEMMKTMGTDMKYHLSITVPGKIKSSSNKETSVSNDKKTATLETNFADLLTKKTTLEMKLKYK